MCPTTHSTEELAVIYQRRFAGTSDYRRQVWSVLTRSFFSRWIPCDASVLDLGCGYGEFINQTEAGKKFAMDLNPDAAQYLNPDITHICQDCSAEWPLPTHSLDVVFTSNFFEHLPDKERLLGTLRQGLRCLRPGGRLLAMGPNIKYLPGKYWDFFDHHTMLTEASLSEALEICGFQVETAIARFMPYTLVNARRYPLWIVRAYLAVPVVWRLLGRQFLIVARRPDP